MTTIGVRELKAKAGEVLREVSQKRKEFIITSHGRPCGKIVPLKEEPEAPSGKKTLRGAYPHLPELDEKDFRQIKNIWLKNHQ
ncbi:MAG: type II toxin-antitoxin system prevent-host-death family antitoxin [Actinomycetota bacterium]|nr:type II toxin-antitoxin system prevent-host-death family antitoxin [Actinomycetota bacterium]